MRQQGDLPSHLHWQHRASERARARERERERERGERERERERGGRERERERERESLTTIPHCRQLVLEEKGFVDGLIDDEVCTVTGTQLRFVLSVGCSTHPVLD